jgi:hypothetical protein
MLTAVAHLCGGLFILNAKPCTTTVYVAAVQPTIDYSTLPNIPMLAYAAKSKNTTASLETWHCWLGHANRVSVKRLEWQKMVRGMEINDMSTNSNDSPCSSCLHEKQTRAPIPQTPTSITHASTASTQTYAAPCIPPL